MEIMGHKLKLFILSIILLGTRSWAAELLPNIIEGRMDLRAWDLHVNGIVPLDGEWFFEHQKFSDPSAALISSDPKYAMIPQLWNDNNAIMSQDYGTYHLTVIGDFVDKSLAIEIPASYCSYRLFINGDELASNGKPGKDRESSVPQWRGVSREFKSKSDTLTFVIHVSNFRHFKGGINSSLFLGTAEDIFKSRRKNEGVKLASVTGLILIGLCALLICYSSKKKVLVYIGLLCLDWAIRGLFTDLYLFINWFPNFSWTAAVKIEYLTLTFGLMLWTSFISMSFERESNKSVMKLIVLISACYALLILVFPPIIFTSLLSVFQLFGGLSLLYIIYVVVKATINGNIGIWFLTGSVLLLILLIFYNLFSFQKMIVLDPVILNIGYLLFFLFNAITFVLKSIKNKTMMI